MGDRGGLLQLQGQGYNFYKLAAESLSNGGGLQLHWQGYNLCNLAAESLSDYGGGFQLERQAYDFYNLPAAEAGLQLVDLRGALGSTYM